MLQLSTTVICTCPFSIFEKPDWSPGLQDPGRRSDMLIKRSQVLQGCWRRLALDLRIIGWPWIKNCLMQWPCFKGADEYWRYPTLLENDKVSLWRSCCFLLLIGFAISPTKKYPWFSGLSKIDLEKRHDFGQLGWNDFQPKRESNPTIFGVRSYGCIMGAIQIHNIPTQLGRQGAMHWSYPPTW